MKIFKLTEMAEKLDPRVQKFKQEQLERKKKQKQEKMQAARKRHEEVFLNQEF